MRKTILFRVDGGKVWGISMGHIKRALLLANVLSGRYSMVFVMKNYRDGVEYVKSCGYPVEVIDIDDNSSETLIALCQKHVPARIFFDLYSNPYTRVFEYARAKGIESVVFDILGKCIGIPDILINDSFVKDFANYQYAEGKSKIYLGPDYFLMERYPEITPIRDNVADIMVTMGGSDPAGLTIKVLRCLCNESQRIKGLRIHVVLGQLFTGREDVLEIVGGSDFMTVHESPPEFLYLLGRQDVVITSAGRTLYESAYLGRPLIILPSIDHEAVTSSEYARLTGSFDIGCWNDLKSPEKILAALEKFRGNRELRHFVFASNRSLVDGNAMERILAALGEHV